MLETAIYPFIEDSFGFIKSENQHFNFAFVLHEKGNSNNLVFSSLQTNDEPQKTSDFIEFLTQNSPKTFDECVLIATYFHELCSSADTYRKIITNEKVFNPALNYIFNDSFGFILYNHHLEQLYDLRNFNSPKSIEFRKGINKKDAHYHEIAKKLSLNEGQNFLEIINQKMIFDYVLSPNLFGASNLINILKISL